MHQPSIFDNPPPEPITLTDGLSYFSNFLDPDTANNLLSKLATELNWHQPSIPIVGKQVPIPRLQSWQAEREDTPEPIIYKYSNVEFSSEPFHEDIKSIKLAIEQRSGYQFNSVLCNYYRDGKDSVSWHADDEPELGQNPVIASYSLGATRNFQIKLKDKSRKLQNISLEHNSLLIMPPGFQAKYVHQIPKSSKISSPRINLTFRYTY